MRCFVVCRYCLSIMSSSSSLKSALAYHNADDVRVVPEFSLPVPKADKPPLYQHHHENKKSDNRTSSSNPLLAAPAATVVGNKVLPPSGSAASEKKGNKRKHTVTKKMAPRYSGDSDKDGGFALSTFQNITATMECSTISKDSSLLDSDADADSGTTAVKKISSGSDKSLVELRNYASLMDQYSLHNFMIYKGKALKSTPEFVSFHHDFKNEWGGIYSIITQLESVMASHDVKLAIINGVKVYELSALNLPYINREDLIDCVANIQQIMPQLMAITSSGNSQVIRAVVKIQTHIRKWLATVSFTRKTWLKTCLEKIQAQMRRFLVQMKINRTIQCPRAAVEQYWAENNIPKLLAFQERCHRLFRQYGVTAHVSKHKHFKKDKKKIPFYEESAEDEDELEYHDHVSEGILLVHIGSVNNVFESTRTSLNNMTGLQNSHIACLHQLADPLITIVFIVNAPVTAIELNYHIRVLVNLNISEKAVERIHFITPEMITKMPKHTPLSSVLWYSSEALQKLRLFTNKFKNSLIIPATVGWVEKRLAYFLKVPVACIDPTVALTLASKSIQKDIFTDACVNVPVGVHDVYTEEDILVALARLIATNTDVNRWVLKLNHDYNNESACIFTLDKMPFLKVIRDERTTLQKLNENDAHFWYGRSIQVSVRKRLLKALQSQGVFPKGDVTEAVSDVNSFTNNVTGALMSNISSPSTARSKLSSRSGTVGAKRAAKLPVETMEPPGAHTTDLLHICRPDICPTWSQYCVQLKALGGIIEAEPPGDILGHMRCSAYINPLEPYHSSNSSVPGTPHIVPMSTPSSPDAALPGSPLWGSRKRGKSGEFANGGKSSFRDPKSPGKNSGDLNAGSYVRTSDPDDPYGFQSINDPFADGDDNDPTFINAEFANDPLDMSEEQYYQHLMKMQTAKQSDEVLAANDGMLPNLWSADVRILGAVEMIMDCQQQYQGCICPQTQIPKEALHRATVALCNTLYSKYQAVGHVEVTYLVFWDSSASIPRIWGLNFTFGCGYVSNCCGVMSRVTYMVDEDKQVNLQKIDLMHHSGGKALNATFNSTFNTTGMSFNDSLGGASSISDIGFDETAMNTTFNTTMNAGGAVHDVAVSAAALALTAPDPTHNFYDNFLVCSRNPSLAGTMFEGRVCVYFPVMVHMPLKGTRDEVFYKLCAMHAITYDSSKQIGTIFFLVDNIVTTGTVSCMCVSTTRIKALEMMNSVVTFVCQHFGKDSPNLPDGSTNQLYRAVPTWDMARSMRIKMKEMIDAVKPVARTIPVG